MSQQREERAEEVPTGLDRTLGVPQIVFMVVAMAAPLTVFAGLIPLMLGSGNGIGTPIDFVIVGVVLVLFTVGYSAMTPGVRNAGAFYSYVQRGLGTGTGLGAATLALVTYSLLMVAVSAYLGAAARNVIETFSGVSVPWWCLAAAGLGAIGYLGYRNVEVSARVLGALLIAEVGIVALLDLAIVLRGGDHGLSAHPLVLDDADLDVTADGILTGMTNLNGQWCEGPGKVLAPHRLVRPLREALDERIARLRIGHSLDEESDIGPISNEPHYRNLIERIEGLRGLGAEIDQPGELPGLTGFFLSPTIATGSDPDRTTAELFGPIVSLHGVDSDEDALRAANAHPSGLDAYVFGTDTDRAIAIGARVMSGEVRINGAKLADLGDNSAQSFWGPSGIGGHGPAESVRVFCGDRVVGVDSPDLPL
ncbi:aldehyde dehydrogenase family protein [Nocardia abscessus]|uniref:aldehyde dehydrogenase family protein n=1 Tax=Nocardia abscessus TaxID=120957 RepID=UPI001E55ABA6|nr:aldehyde dehydrogenase family protein [Nocardia abscessus]